MRSYKGDKWFKPFTKGKKDANKHFVLTYYPILMTHAGIILRGDSVAEEIVMDTFLKAWERHERFNDIIHLRRFLFLVTTRACLRHLRELQKQKKKLQEYRYFTETIAKAPSLENDSPARYSGLLRAINSLPKLNRRIIELCVVEGKSNGEAANILRISTRMVTYRKYQVLQALRNSMGR
jgi:RNA polymerase sigma factor (sigma-70 family)